MDETVELKTNDKVRQLSKIEEIPASDLLERCLELKREGLRFSQACAAYYEDKFHLTYTFSNYETLEALSLRVVISPDEEIHSITEFIPAALFYENEMKEIFGVKIKLITNDLNNKLYRINVEAPLGVPQEEKKEEENNG
ncbi:NADH-quinone oxidoreductase subunit C [Lachnospira multipara]|uniref:Ech hydrogenase subunit D n=1 Tax=Lachnospira multipara TaxID=28051 RepID=A0A1H5V943_9FIRM|nr:NADH-quinone oxidoreductase subunit C [Lachnospira multipara]SEF83905.1 ech hydrogenase subunit D [Lachnospira multipara]